MMTQDRTSSKGNDRLQSGEKDRASGQDARELGAGGQTVINTQGESEPRDREVDPE